MNNIGSRQPFLNAIPNWLVFTDLDGTLLDHHSYSFAAAQSTLDKLHQLHIPVICNTSKTFSEVILLRQALKNRHPFIVENGAGVYLPLSFLSESAVKAIGGAQLSEGYWRFSLSEPRSHWQSLLRQMKEKFSGLFTSFNELGDAGIARCTGLSLQDAQLANQREFSEPVLWLGDELSKTAFILEANQLGANVLQGGRFLHIVGDSDKGKALLWLQQLYTSRAKHSFKTLAAGDGHNDVQMLEVADFGLLVRSPVNAAPLLRRNSGVWFSEQYGPAGWAEGISQILAL